MSTAKRKSDVQEEVEVAAQDFVGADDRERVPFAGLLVDQPRLRDEAHTPAEWRQLLANYMYPPEPQPPERSKGSGEETH